MTGTLASYEYWAEDSVLWMLRLINQSVHTRDIYIYMTSYSVGLDWANTQEGRSMF